MGSSEPLPPMHEHHLDVLSSRGAKGAGKRVPRGDVMMEHMDDANVFAELVNRDLRYPTRRGDSGGGTRELEESRELAWEGL